NRFETGPHRSVDVLRYRHARRAKNHLPNAPLLPAEHVEADVRRNPIQPGAQRRSAFEPIEPAPRTDERLLDRVLRLERGREHAVAVAVQLGTMELELLLEPSANRGARRLHATTRQVPLREVAGRSVCTDAALPSPRRSPSLRRSTPSRR